MAGNDQRRGARRTTSKKGPTVGSGGVRRAGLKGKGRNRRKEVAVGRRQRVVALSFKRTQALGFFAR